MKWASKQRGFTIVELLIVIVVIAILAAITIVAYSGIQERTRASSAATTAASALKKIEEYKNTIGGGSSYPADGSLVTSLSSSSVSVQYFHSVEANTYCVQAVSGTQVSSVSSSNSVVVNEPCINVGLSGWWQLNGDGVDATGLASAGTVVSGSFVNDRNGNVNSAINFTGIANQGVVLPRPGTYTELGDSSFTTSAWIRTTDTAAQRCIFSIAGAGDGLRFGHTNGDPYFLIGNTSGHVERAISAGNVLRNGQWNLLSMTFTRIDAGWFIQPYINGTATNSSIANAGQVGPGNVANIGNMNSGSGGLFRGDIDDLRLYSRPITAEEALALYQAGPR